MSADPAPHTRHRHPPSAVRWVCARVRTGAFVTDVLQIIKCTLAATVAWWLTAVVLDSQMPFLAPWTALLAVHATVYRSLTRGIQTAVATGLGVGMAYLIGTLFDEVSLWSFALAVFLGMAGSRLTWLRAEGVAIATTAIFVLGGGFDDQAPLLGDRLLEVGIGVGVGLVVNFLVVPPLRDRQAASYVDSINRRLGRVLIQMADELENSWDTDRAQEWVAATESMDEELTTAWGTIRYARESARVNPRAYVPWAHRARRREGRGKEEADEIGYDEILSRVGEGISHLRHLARTIRESTYAESQWDDDFRREWAATVRDTGHAVADPHAVVEPIADRLDALARRFSGEDGLPSGELWPVYGSLVTSMRHIATVVDDVASAREARDSSRPNPTA
ncbi:aromatic acid exporter family protein [Ruania halotolerans]|uniref:aromatic acid exporter family protein n=1 Tax=Ruania halotolerans TaxID=2897773 RepID=UPI001E4F11A3|nr:aromatic acid exporter family protein [Ruania halotolerans]UFU06011.1 aromatic acid exporter family protein [Ruania halotolerans]